MPELTVDDVIAYTGGRLVDDDETARLLAAALAAARTFCGWHVTPVLADVEVTLDGPNDPLLDLPTMGLVDLTDVTENGVTLDVDNDLLWQAANGRPVRGVVRKPFGAYWTGRHSGITVTMDHGFDAAPDFDAAVLAAVDMAAQAKSRSDPALVEKSVDDVTYRWSQNLVISMLDVSLLVPYRLVTV